MDKELNKNFFYIYEGLIESASNMNQQFIELAYMNQWLISSIANQIIDYWINGILKHKFIRINSWFICLYQSTVHWNNHISESMVIEWCVLLNQWSFNLFIYKNELLIESMVDWNNFLNEW